MCNTSMSSAHARLPLAPSNSQQPTFEPLPSVHVCRYMYHESLGRWRSSDLLIGLAYLAQQESAAHAARDIAKAGCLVGFRQPKEERLRLAVGFSTPCFERRPASCYIHPTTMAVKLPLLLRVSGKGSILKAQIWNLSFKEPMSDACLNQA